MTESKDPALPEGAERKEREAGGGHKGLVFGAAFLVSVGVIVAGVYGMRARPAGALVLKALALEGAMVALAAWLSLHAFRIRRRVSEAFDWEAYEARGPSDWEEVEEEGVGVTLQDAQHSRTIHFAVLAIPATVLVGFLALYTLWTQSGREAGVLPQADIAAASVICLVACCLWLVLSRAFEGLGRDELPEGPALMLGFRDLQWTTLLAAAGILGTLLWPKDILSAGGERWSPPEVWVARILLVWTLAIVVEQLLRVAVSWLRRDWVDERFASPVHLLLREAVFLRGNPIASLFETIEARFGVSFRSSWAIRFVRAAALPSLVAVVLVFWGITCLSIVGVDELGIRESFGQIRGELPWNLGTVRDDPLPPGLHVKVPWPFGRVRHYPVKSVFAMPIGFVPSAGHQRAYLWTKIHAEEEFAMVLGNDAEVVAVNALVYYKIREDKEGFLQYVYRFADSPDDGLEARPGRASVETALDAYAHRALMELTRSATLEEVLSANRAEFANALKESLGEYAEANRLGIDVIDVALVVMHPPIEAAADYLDVISAQIDAERVQIAANGEHKAAIEMSRSESQSTVAEQNVLAAERIGTAYEKSAEILALSEAYAAAPEAFKQRLWFETHEDVLADKPLIVVDEEVYIDMRQPPQTPNVIPSGAP